MRRVNGKEGETRGCSGQRKAKLKPVVVEPVASEQQRNQADLRQRVTQEQQEVSTWGGRKHGLRRHSRGWYPWPAG